MDRILKLINLLKQSIIARRIKLLRTEALHKPKKVQKHETKLMELELELRRLKDVQFNREHRE